MKIPWLKKIKIYLNEVKSEMKKVTWPSKDEVLGTTTMVIVSSIILAIFLWIVDWVLQHLLIIIYAKLGV